MKTLESMNYREQDFDMCGNCKCVEFGYEGECGCKKIKEDGDNELPIWNLVSITSICDEYEREIK